ncbi:MAG: ORF6N domain-containing protein [Bacilli bacterium]|nr:ORF6N domain-containing protein [Bacilli bacterium]
MEELIKNDENIKNKIYVIRGKQVMLDSDLAELYECKNGTKEVNQAVKNNIEKFPERYSWTLTDDEWKLLRSKFLTLETNSIGKGKYRKYMPRVFTEQGIAMLATILHTPVATQVSISIMDAFVNMRHYLYDNNEIYKALNYINNKLIEYDESFNILFSKFDKKELLFFNGEVFDAYSYIYDLINEAYFELIIIDPYADIKILGIIKDFDCRIKLITSKKAKLSDVQVDLFNEQYNKLTVFRTNVFHDRYFIIDRESIYHIGTSFNHLGEKVFSITKFEDEMVKKELLNYVEKTVD